MATIDMRGADTYFYGWGYGGVGFGAELLATPTAYVWEDSSGFAGTIVYLYGSGIVSSGGAPTAGTIDEIRIDLNGDGFLGGTDVDITITGISLSLVDLAQDNDLFWETVLQGSDTIFPFFYDPRTNISFMSGDGVNYRGSAGSLLSDDLFDATWTLGNVKLWGDYQALADAEVIAGDDTLVSAYAPGGVSAIGDIGEVSAVSDDASVTGGDDVIEIASSSDSHLPHIKHLVGDVETVAPSAIAGVDILVTGGDDTVTNLGGGAFISIVGDVLEVLAGPGGADIIGGDDTLTGSGASEDIAGDVLELGDGFVDGGDDFIDGGDGDDNIAGDVLRQTGGGFTGGDDIIDGGEGADTIDGQSGTDTVSYFKDPFGVIVVLDNGGVDGSSIGQGSDVLRDIENVLGSITADTVTGNDEANVVLAFEGNDSLSGLGGADTLYGWDDNDTLRGGEGADSLYGGDGNDLLTGGSGDDTLKGESGTDRVDFSAYSSGVTGNLLSGVFTAVSTDTVSGVENVTGSRFADELGGDALGNDIVGGRGNDTLLGDAGNDTLAGSAGRDTLDGAANSDWADYSAAGSAVTVDLSVVGVQNTGEGLDELLSIENLIGSGFGDALTGSNAANFLRGSGGLDTLTGGGGADRFEFDGTADSGNTNLTADEIADFVQGSDFVDLRTIDAMSGTSGNQAFSFVGTDAFSAEGQVRYFQNGNDTFVQVNSTGSAGSEMTLRLSGFLTPTVADFLL